MRLIRFRFGDRIAHGALDDGTVRVLRGTFFEDPLPTGEEVPLDDVRLLAPVLPSKVVAVARNYAAHARELGNPMPERPLLFLKPPSAVIRHGEAIHLPAFSQQVEHEGEIGIVVGHRLRQATEQEARDAVRAIACVNGSW